MTKKDMKYRNRVLRRQAGKQYRDVSKLIKKRLLSALKYQVTHYEGKQSAGTLSAVADAAMDGIEPRISQIRIKNDQTRKYADNVAKEIKRLSDKEKGL